MTNNVVTKSLAGAEDILRGVDQVNQIRNGQPYIVNQVHLPVAVSSTELMAAINPADTTFVNVIKNDLYISYKYSATDITGITSPFGGSWLVYRSSGEVVSVKDFGAIGDGAVDDTLAINAANASTGRKFVPKGLYKTNIADGSLKGPFIGEGQIVGADNNKRGQNYVLADSPPSSRGDNSSVLTAFNGDWSKSVFSTEYRITGAATLGQPTSGYLYTPERTPNYTYLFNTSGWNNSTSSNAGRTGAAAHMVKIDQYGQGDAVAYNASVFIASTKSGSTHFLANPAGVIFNGGMTAGANGIYFNPHEIMMDDNGYDIAAIGFVANFKRTVGTGAKTAIWHGARYQSVGTVPCDAIITAPGPWKNGIDFSLATTDFGANQAAISLKGGQRIYFNNAANASGNTESGWHTTVYNGDYIGYIGGSLLLVAGGNPNLQISSSQVTALGAFMHTGAAFSVFNASPVGKLTGWGTPTGNSVVANFPGASASLTQCSNAIAQIITYMKQLGFYGA